MNITTLSKLHTLTVKELRTPTRVDVLLRELVVSARLASDDAYEIAARALLPLVLRRVSKYAEHADQSWACWTNDRGDVWFFVAERLPASEQALQLDHYGEDGLIRGTSRWIADVEGNWSTY